MRLELCFELLKLGGHGLEPDEQRLDGRDERFAGGVRREGATDGGRWVTSFWALLG